MNDKLTNAFTLLCQKKPKKSYGFGFLKSALNGFPFTSELSQVETKIEIVSDASECLASICWTSTRSF